MKEAWEAMRHGDIFNEFTLMTIATIGAFYIGEYPEGVAVMLFYSLGEWFQDKAVNRAKHSISALLDVRPETATVIRQGQEARVNPREVMPGEVIEVKTGERVPLDGNLQNETAAFNTSALTGESLPRNIHQGEEVLAGMIATDRVVRLTVTKPFEQSALSRILKMVQEASDRKAPAELFIRKFARIYTPAVTGLALLIVLLPCLWSLIQPSFAYAFDDWLYRGLVFLVISCPCALVVSIPLGYFGGIGAASRQGILFKGGNYLDAITQVDTVVFDKTGTLTQGRFEVSDVQASSLQADELLALVASMEQGSNHPVGQAVVRAAKARGLALETFAREEELSGLGIRAVLDDGRVCLAGNVRLMRREGIALPPSADAVEETAVFCAVGGQYAGCIVLADVVKPDSVEAVRRLRALGIRDIEMLSGDREGIVTRMAGRLGIDRAWGDLLPEGKVEHLKALKDKGRRTAFVGDGMNDAPVLALADVGIAMGGLGSDAAIETADVVIQTDQPSKVAEAVRLGRRTRHVVWQNITFALAVKLVILALGAMGMAGLWAAVFADVGVAMLAICNALRIQLSRTTPNA